MGSKLVLGTKRDFNIQIEPVSLEFMLVILSIHTND